MLAEVNRLHQESSLGAPAGGSFAGPYVSDFEKAPGLDADHLLAARTAIATIHILGKPNYVGRISQIRKPKLKVFGKCDRNRQGRFIRTHSPACRTAQN